MTNMERFIRDHREEFDNMEPSPKIWDQIESGVFKKNPPARVFRMTFLKWSVAAAILISVFTAAYFFFSQEKSVNGPEIAKTNPVKQDPLVKDIDPQYAQMVAQFSSLIESKQKELSSTQKDNPELYKQFSGDIQRLDSTYQVLRNTLSANPNKEQLLQAMIGNLQMQIDLLNQQLNIIQKVKHPAKEKI